MHIQPINRWWCYNIDNVNDYIEYYDNVHIILHWWDIQYNEVYEYADVIEIDICVI